MTAPTKYKPTVRIANSYRVPFFGGGLYLAGNVLDHPRFEEGYFIHTSRILSEVDGIVETENTLYEIVDE